MPPGHFISGWADNNSQPPPPRHSAHGPMPDQVHARACRLDIGAPMRLSPSSVVPRGSMAAALAEGSGRCPSSGTRFPRRSGSMPSPIPLRLDQHLLKAASIAANRGFVGIPPHPRRRAECGSTARCARWSAVQTSLGGPKDVVTARVMLHDPVRGKDRAGEILQRSCPRTGPGRKSKRHAGGLCRRGTPTTDGPARGASRPRPRHPHRRLPDARRPRPLPRPIPSCQTTSNRDAPRKGHEPARQPAHDPAAYTTNTATCGPRRPQRLAPATSGPASSRRSFRRDAAFCRRLLAEAAAHHRQARGRPPATPLR